MEIKEQIKEIKQSFRLMMDGMVAASMRNKGVDYKLNWGATLPRLKSKAEEIGQNYDLAIALWKENVRECKILASLLMPIDQMPAEVADIWVDQMPTAEIAQTCSMFLLSREPWAPQLAFQWIAADSPMRQLCGFLILARLLSQGAELNERSAIELRDQAAALLPQADLHLRKAIHATLSALDR